MRSKPIIAIDGPSGAGKSTVARGLAKLLDFNFIDTGAIYRTVAKLADETHTSWDNEKALAAIAIKNNFSFDAAGNISLDGVLLGDSIRTSRISRGASAIAKHKDVRNALLSIQRKMGTSGGVVLEGRDIGTVIFPDAEVKFFLIASVKTRSKRRYMELIANGEQITLEQVEEDQENRDKADSERNISPLTQANDAILINCDALTIKQVILSMKTHVVTKFTLTTT